MKKVVVLLPTYNERENIEKFTQEILSQEKNLQGWRVEVLIVDSNSPDGTGKLAQELASNNSKIHYLEVERGMGVALVKGHQYTIEHLNPDALAQLDADGQVSVEVLPRLIRALEEGSDLALGSRFVPGGKNMLSLSRRIFSSGMSWVCRVIMGPFEIREFANSARAFTPALFKSINLNRLPWREKTFIIQPAFLNEAILAGAKYQEVPLVFKNRAEGYSKNKIVNYTYDVIAYALDARLHQWGITFPLFYLSRRSKTFIKFGVVGFTGTIIDFTIYNLLIVGLNLRPATAKGFSTEVAILSNFALNNIWTFKYRRTKKTFQRKLLIFNLVSFGGLTIGVLIVKFLHTLYGDGIASIGNFKLHYYNIYFLATILPVLLWNFTVNHLVTWKQRNQ